VALVDGAAAKQRFFRLCDERKILLRIEKQSSVAQVSEKKK
jgi:hypothetical protein